MSRRRGRAEPQPVTGTDKKALIHALDLLRRMSKAEWEFILAIPAPAAVPVPEAGSWAQRGLVVHVGDWFAITPGGLRQLDSNLTPSWLLALAWMPPRELLKGLVRDGIIENVNGFPALTPFGELVQAQIREANAFIAARPELYEDGGDDLDGG